MKKIFDTISNFIYSNIYITIIFYVVLLSLIIIVIYKIKTNYIGDFHGTNIFRRLKKIYKKYDYPFIKEIILPINKETYAYYDAIVFGNKFIYILEIKNHEGLLLIDPIDDWVFQDNKNNKYKFINPFYELDLKKHILNRFLDIDKQRFVQVVVYNNKTTYQGDKAKNHLISDKQISSLIKHYEAKDIPKFSCDFIEEKGNYILDINIRKRTIRNKVISDLKNERKKR